MSQAYNELVYKNMINSHYNTNQIQMQFQKQHHPLVDESTNEDHDTSATNETTTSSSSISNNLQSDASIAESDSDDKVEENDFEDDVIVKAEVTEIEDVNDESSEDDEEEDLTERKPVVQLPNISQYQQNCLAAAQMMQLMCSTTSSLSSLSSSSSSSSSNTANLNQSNNTSPNGLALSENEKENIPICKYCNKIFANFSNLNHHVSAIHLNQSKWVCSQCGKICSSKSNLKVHLRVHLRVKPYHCRWCTYSCMHHSSIRDHLAKVHPDKTHTPLQPGYLFNSQAVPEPEVFNAKGFNANSFVNESKSKRASSEALSIDKSPEKARTTKKIRLNNDKPVNSKQVNQTHVSRSRSPVKPNIHQQFQQQQQQVSYPQIQTPPVGQIHQNMQQSLPTSSNQQSMSNLYSAYTMARMFPFMYNPMQMQYAAAAAVATQNSPHTLPHQHQQQQQHSSPTSQFLGMLNQNMLQYNNQSRPSFNYGSLIQDNSSLPNNNVFSSLLSASTNNSSSSSSSDEHPTNSSGNYSYSGSSRSSSLSPSNKGTNEIMSMMSKQMSTSTSTDEGLQTNLFEKSKLASTINDQSSKSSNSRKTLTVEQMLNNSNKVSKETQTETSCLKCPHCKISI